jgi:hypothetical protein
MARAEARTSPPSARATPELPHRDRRLQEPQRRPQRKPVRQGRVRPEKQGRDGKDNHEESSFSGERCPEDADIPDRRKPRPIDHDGRDAPHREKQHNGGDRDAKASPGHAPSHRLAVQVGDWQLPQLLANVGVCTTGQAIVRSNLPLSHGLEARGKFRPVSYSPLPMSTARAGQFFRP